MDLLQINFPERSGIKYSDDQKFLQSSPSLEEVCWLSQRQGLLLSQSLLVMMRKL